MELVQTALGSDEVPIVIENVMPWKAEADVAERFRGADLPRRRRGARDATQWRVRRQHRCPGCPQPRVEAGDGAERDWPGRGCSRPTSRNVVRSRRFTMEQAYSRYVTRTAPYLGTDGIHQSTAI